jgi:hypothetical protein
VNMEFLAKDKSEVEPTVSEIRSTRNAAAKDTYVRTCRQADCIPNPSF